ncbi:MAG: DUF424 domain-containing protein [Halobacteriaceae archaeon]
MILTERSTEQGLLVTVCDSDALGQTFEDEERGVSLDVTESFYGGETADPPAVRDALDRAQVANIVGTRSVELAVEAGVVDEENVLEIDGTLHAQYLRL